MKENNDDFFTDDLTGFPPGMLDDVKETSDLSIPGEIINKIREETKKTAEDAAYFVCKTTYEITQFDAYGQEIVTRTTSEQQLISNDNSIQAKKMGYMSKAEYMQFREEYLQSAKWQAKRQMVLSRDHYVCQMCGRAFPLNVHHITYENFGNESLSDLITLCRECHTQVHKVKGQKTEARNKISLTIKEAQELVIAFILQRPRTVEIFAPCLTPDYMGDYEHLYDSLCSDFWEDIFMWAGDLPKMYDRIEWSRTPFKTKAKGVKELPKFLKVDLSEYDAYDLISIVVGE